MTDDADGAPATIRPWTTLLVRSASETFSPSPGAPRQVRRFVADTIRAWGFGNLCETAELLVSEIVTNVVLHAHTDGHVAATALPSGVRVEITDHGRELPTRRIPTSAEAEGRGLGIVATLSRRWGVRIGDDHSKTVWFELDDVADPQEAVG